MKSEAYVVGGLAGVFGILIAGGFVYATVRNHQATSTTGSTNTTTNQTVGNVPERPKVVSGNDLVKQKMHFKAVLPSYLPKGFSKYTARLDNFAKGWSNPQVLFLLYRGPGKSRIVSIQEFPYPNHKLPAIFKRPAGKPVPPNVKDYATINGTYVFGPGKFTFVSHGINFTVNSVGVSNGEEMKVVKSLIHGGKPFD